MTKRIWPAALLGAIIFSGCAGNKNKVRLPATASASPQQQQRIVVPARGFSGKVASVNQNLRFAVLSFPIDQIPSVDTRLGVYRNGAKVGEVKITGPQTDQDTVADIIAGDPRKGDEIRTE